MVVQYADGAQGDREEIHSGVGIIRGHSLDILSSAVLIAGFGLTGQGC
jgi:hypothetical protein